MAITHDITLAVETLRAGGLVAMPTETVYGLAADAENELAVRRIFAAKGRPADHPLIVHLASANELSRWVAHVPEQATLLAAAFWPGPLTLILPRSPKAAPAVTGGLETIGVRVPAHPVAQALLQTFGGGLAAPSANRFGRVSPTTAQHVWDELGEQIPLILEGGECAVGVESTILDLSQEEPCLLRPGAITPTQIEQILQRPLVDPATNATRCSGRLESHYAPRAAVEIVAWEHLVRQSELWQASGKRVALLSETCPAACKKELWIPLPQEPAACARRLYAALREADQLGAEIALVVAPPNIGLGFAVADRLQKAAAAKELK
jgi:L-threonylcarbamoyladenylate synthase